MKLSNKPGRTLPVLAAVIIAAAAALIYSGALTPGVSSPPANAIMVIAPYKHAGTWVFDDPATGLKQEPFVSGIPEMIDEAVKDIPDAKKGFRLIFSVQPFPGYTHKLVWRRGDKSGNWYYNEQYDMEGWLCPALFRYYPEAPKEIYLKAEKK